LPDRKTPDARRQMPDASREPQAPLLPEEGSPRRGGGGGRKLEAWSLKLKTDV
jgi:hypothetical protein